MANPDNLFTRVSKAIFNERALPPTSYNMNGMAPVTSELNYLKHQMQNQKNIYSDIRSERMISTALSAVYTGAVKSKIDYCNQFEEIRNHYLVDALLSNLSDNALTPDVSSGDILRVETDREDLKEELERFQDEFDLDSIVNDFVYDLLSYGEYALKLKVENGRGVIEILDNVEPNTIVASYRQGYPYKFMVRDGKNINFEPPSAYAHFMLRSNKLRIRPFDGISDDDKKKLPLAVKDFPSHVRVGKPILYGVLSKIKELDIMEKIVPAMRIQEIQNASFVSIEVPPNTDPKEAFNIADAYSQMLNKKVTQTDSGQLTAIDILTQAGQIKAIPTWNGKGGITPLDVRSNATNENILANIRDYRDIICSTIGVPTELLYGGAEPSEMIKKYNRYLRKIKSIQTSIAFGILQIIVAHFTNLSGYDNVLVSDFEVQFMNETVNLDELEKLEYHDAVQSMVRNTFSFIAEMAQSGYDDLIDDNKFRKWLSEKIEFIDEEADEDKGSDYVNAVNTPTKGPINNYDNINSGKDSTLLPPPSSV